MSDKSSFNILQAELAEKELFDMEVTTVVEYELRQAFYSLAKNILINLKKQMILNGDGNK